MEEKTCDGYVVEVLEKGKWKKLAYISGKKNTSYKVASLSAGTRYTFRVRVYTMKDGKRKIKKAGMELETVTKPAKLKKFAASQVDAGKLTLSWEKDSMADGYQIKVYQNGKWETISTIKNNKTVKKTISGLKSKKTYKFRIRSYVILDGVKIYGDYVTTEPGTAAAASAAKKSVHELAREVISGKWGDGDARKGALAAAGYDYAAVQAEVNALMK